MGKLITAASFWLFCIARASHAVSDSDVCTAGGWVLQEKCLPALGGQAKTGICCSTLRGLQELGCFCNKQTGRLVPSLDLWSVLAICGLEVETDGDRLCFSSRSGTRVRPEVEDTLSEHHVEGTNLQAPSREQSKAVDYRPVLDLSAIPDTVTTIFESNKDGQVTIRYTEDQNDSSDSTFSVDVVLPELADVNVDLTYSFGSDEGAGVDVAASASDSALSLDDQHAGEVQTSLLEQDPQDLETAEDSAEKEAAGITGTTQTSFASPCQHASVGRGAIEPGSLEVSVGLPQGFFGGFQQSDVTIDMEYNPEAESFNSAAVTLDDGVEEASFNGQAIGSLLKDAAKYLSSELSIPLTTSFSDTDSDKISNQANEGSLIGGALNFLAAVGEDIRDSIPDKQLHDGDIIQIQHDNEEGDGDLLARQGLQSFARRSLGKLSEAVGAAMGHQAANDEAIWIEACSVCEMVHRYIYVLWTIIIAGAAVLAYCIVSTGIRAFSDIAPTDPNKELRQPLIICAADYIGQCDSDETLMLPVWSPPRPLQ